MAQLVRRNKCEPIVKTQVPEKRMPPIVFAQFPSMCLFQERTCPFAYTAQFGNHHFFARVIFFGRDYPRRLLFQ